MTPLAGVALAGTLALLGRALSWLTTGGAAAAALVGAAVFVGGGWTGASWLALFFVSGSVLGDRPLEPGSRTGGRTWRQVAANGGWAAVGMVLVLAGHFRGWALAAGALAAATADTWATEIGTRFGRRPVLITTGRPVPVGTSGGISLAGSVGALAGAAALGTLCWLTRGDTALGIAAVLGGVTGMFADSLLGATVQGVYACEDCGRQTEAPLRHAGHRLTRVRGWRWIDNDVVNLVGTGVGAALALALAR